MSGLNGIHVYMTGENVDHVLVPEENVMYTGGVPTSFFSYQKKVTVHRDSTTATEEASKFEKLFSYENTVTAYQSFLKHYYKIIDNDKIRVIVADKSKVTTIKERVFCTYL